MTHPPLHEVILEAVTAAQAGFPPDDALVTAIAKGGAAIQLEDLGFDSLAWMEFCISIELATGAELTPDHLEDCGTLADIAARIESWRAS